MLIALLAAAQAQAGGIRDFLLSEPGVVFRTLPQAARAGLVANAELGKSRTTEATNRMGNTSKIDTLTTDYVAVQLSGSSSVALTRRVTGSFRRSSSRPPAKSSAGTVSQKPRPSRPLKMSAKNATNFPSVLK